MIRRDKRFKGGFYGKVLVKLISNKQKLIGLLYRNVLFKSN